MKAKVTAYQARTNLPALLIQVKAGKCFAITERGRPIAELGPPQSTRPSNARAAIDAFLAFRTANPVGRKVNIKKLIEEGRE
jgi:antitoxin (DNA-binding transcriptional repressor) of toxin-antitoxin stability system